MKRLIILLLIFCAVSKTHAQLASNRPLDSVFSVAAKQKLQQPKVVRSANAGLPSVAPLPKAVVAAQRNLHRPSAVNSPAQVQKQLPSNRKTVAPEIHPPKKSG